MPLAKVTAAATSSACGPYCVVPRAVTSATGLCTKRVHQIEIVDHQVQHGADIVAAAGPGTTAPALDFQRRHILIEQAGAGEDETLLMADGQGSGRSCAPAPPVPRLRPTVVAMGFSTSTWAPAFRKARTMAAWVTAGEQIETRSTLPSKLAPVGHGQHAILGGGGAADFGAGIGDGEQFHARQWRGIWCNGDGQRRRRR